MSDQLISGKASDHDADQAIGVSNISSIDGSSLAKKAKHDPIMFLRSFDSALKSRGEDDKAFENEELNELDESIGCSIITHHEFWDSIGYSLLKNAVESGLIAVVQVILKHADKNATKTLEANYPPLLLACKAGHIEIVSLMLVHGFNPDLAGVGYRGHNETCLTYACLRSNLALVELLLINGAKPDLYFRNEDPPIVQACGHGAVDIVILLLDYGADINIISRYGDTPLTRACAYGHLDLARLLLDRGADVNGVDRDGITPLMTAIRDQPHNIGLIQLLLERGADPAITDISGRVPLDYVTEGSEVAQMIINAQLEHVLK